MKKKFRKMLLLIAGLLVTVNAVAYDFEVNGIYYNITSSSERTVGVVSGYYSVYQGNVIIPSKVLYNSLAYKVTSIGEDAFRDCSGLTSVTIPNSVTSIGEAAFRDCSGLTSVTIPNSVTSIGKSAFSGCSGLTSITIPNSVTSIEYDTFSGCSGLTSVTIPNSVTSIGEYAFSGCSGLTSVTIGNSVTSIGYHAFGGCYGLTSIYCKATTPPTASNPTFEDVVLVNGTLYIPNGSLNSYEAVDPWRNFFNIKETDQFPDGGVEGIEADEIKVVAKGGAIEVSGAEGEQVMVYNLSGQCVYSGMETSVSLEKGIYVVRVAGTVHKIIM